MCVALSDVLEYGSSQLRDFVSSLLAVPLETATRAYLDAATEESAPGTTNAIGVTCLDHPEARPAAPLVACCFSPPAQLVRLPDHHFSGWLSNACMS